MSTFDAGDHREGRANAAAKFVSCCHSIGSGDAADLFDTFVTIAIVRLLLL